MTESPADALKEDVARIVDPISWEMHDRLTASVAINHSYHEEWANALTKAERILALPAIAAALEGREPNPPTVKEALEQQRRIRAEARANTAEQALAEARGEIERLNGLIDRRNAKLGAPWPLELREALIAFEDKWEVELCAIEDIEKYHDWMLQERKRAQAAEASLAELRNIADGMAEGVAEVDVAYKACPVNNSLGGPAHCRSCGATRGQNCGKWVIAASLLEARCREALAVYETYRKKETTP